MTDRIVQNLYGIHALMDSLAGRPTLRAALLSVRREHFCSQTIGRASFRGIEFEILPELTALKDRAAAYDICILCCHNHHEELLLFDLRAAGIASAYFAWMWDNHHHPVEQLRTAVLADCVFVSHWQQRDYLNHPLVFPGLHMPACARQWSGGLISAAYPAGLPAERRNGLFGGFGRYHWAETRNEFIASLMAACPGHALKLGAVADYIALPEAARLALWAEHKVHITVPIAQDVSTRVFDALMTGQIPLVPWNVADLDRIVPPDLQALLPILRYHAGSVDSAKAAWQAGLHRFDADGAAGIARRHAFARDHHDLSNRLERFAEFVRAPGHFELTGDGRRRLWSNWETAPSPLIERASD